MEALIFTFASVLLVELTDKTRLIALLLSARFRAPVQLIVGMTLGYVPAILVAILGAGYISRVISAPFVRWLVALSFFAVAVYLLLPEKAGNKKSQKTLERFSGLSPFWIGFILVAVTEFLDKSQIATAGLMMKYQRGLPVFWGSLLAQAFLNCVYVLAGQSIGRFFPEKWIQKIAAVAFICFGVLALLI